MPHPEYPLQPAPCRACGGTLVATVSVISASAGMESRDAKAKREFRCSVCGIPADATTGQTGIGTGFQKRPEIQTVINWPEDMAPPPPKITYVPRTIQGQAYLDGATAPKAQPAAPTALADLTAESAIDPTIESTVEPAGELAPDPGPARRTGRRKPS